MGVFAHFGPAVKRFDDDFRLSMTIGDGASTEAPGTLMLTATEQTSPRSREAHFGVRSPSPEPTVHGSPASKNGPRPVFRRNTSPQTPPNCTVEKIIGINLQTTKRIERKHPYAPQTNLGLHCSRAVELGGVARVRLHQGHAQPARR